MPFNIKNVNNNPTGQFKVGGPVTILSAAATPFQDGTFAHPFLLATDGVSVYKELSATPGVTLPTWRGSSYYGIYFKFTMPSLSGLQKLRILCGVSSQYPFNHSSTLDAYMGIHSTADSTSPLSFDDDAGTGYAPPGEGLLPFAGGASRIDINIDGSSNPGGASSGVFVVGTQYVICATTYAPNITTGGIRCAAYINVT